MDILITIDDILEMTARLYETEATQKFYDALPMECFLSRWGEEFYGDIPVMLEEDDTMRDVMDVGEIAFWPPGNAFCIVFGPTPMSRGEEPVLASDAIPLGLITDCPLSELSAKGDEVECIIEAL